MHKLAVVGDSDAVLAFQAVGVEAWLVAKDEAENTLRRLYNSGEYAIIFLAENLAEQMMDYLIEAGKRPLPAITLIPLSMEKSNAGIERMRRIGIRATGTDVIGG
jgi:V/A-type H+-transporting ATPase subunit F